MFAEPPASDAKRSNLGRNLCAHCGKSIRTPSEASDYTFDDGRVQRVHAKCGALLRNEKSKANRRLNSAPVSARTRNGGGAGALLTGLFRACKPKNARSPLGPTDQNSAENLASRVRSRRQRQQADENVHPLDPPDAGGNSLPIKDSPSLPAPKRPKPRWLAGDGGSRGTQVESSTQSGHGRQTEPCDHNTEPNRATAGAGNVARKKSWYERWDILRKTVIRRNDALARVKEENRQLKAELRRKRSSGSPCSTSDGSDQKYEDSEDDSSGAGLDLLIVACLHAQQVLEAAGYPDMLQNFCRAVLEGHIQPSTQPAIFWEFLNEVFPNMVKTHANSMRWSCGIKQFFSGVYLAHSGRSAWNELRGPAGHGSGDRHVELKDCKFNFPLPSPEALERHAKTNSADPDFKSGISDRRIAAFANKVSCTALHGSGPDNATLVVHQWDATDVNARRRLTTKLDDDTGRYNIIMHGGEDTNGIMAEQEVELKTKKIELETLMTAILPTWDAEFNHLPVEARDHTFASLRRIASYIQRRIPELEAHASALAATAFKKETEYRRRAATVQQTSTTGRAERAGVLHGRQELELSKARRVASTAMRLVTEAKDVTRQLLQICRDHQAVHVGVDVRVQAAGQHDGPVLRLSLGTTITHCNLANLTSLASQAEHLLLSIFNELDWRASDHLMVFILEDLSHTISAEVARIFVNKDHTKVETASIVDQINRRVFQASEGRLQVIANASDGEHYSMAAGQSTIKSRRDVHKRAKEQVDATVSEIKQRAGSGPGVSWRQLEGARRLVDDLLVSQQADILLQGVGCDGFPAATTQNPNDSPNASDQILLECKIRPALASAIRQASAFSSAQITNSGAGVASDVIEDVPWEPPHPTAPLPTHVRTSVADTEWSHVVKLILSMTGVSNEEILASVNSMIREAYSKNPNHDNTSEALPSVSIECATDLYAFKLLCDKEISLPRLDAMRRFSYSVLYLQKILMIVKTSTVLAANPAFWSFFERKTEEILLLQDYPHKLKDMLHQLQNRTLSESANVTDLLDKTIYLQAIDKIEETQMALPGHQHAEARRFADPSSLRRIVEGKADKGSVACAVHFFECEQLHAALRSLKYYEHAAFCQILARAYEAWDMTGLNVEERMKRLHEQSIMLWRIIGNMMLTHRDTLPGNIRGVSTQSLCSLLANADIRLHILELLPPHVKALLCERALCTDNVEGFFRDYLNHCGGEYKPSMETGVGALRNMEYRNDLRLMDPVTRGYHSMSDTDGRQYNCGTLLNKANWNDGSAINDPKKFQDRRLRNAKRAQRDSSALEQTVRDHHHAPQRR